MILLRAATAADERVDGLVLARVELGPCSAREAPEELERLVGDVVTHGIRGYGERVTVNEGQERGVTRPAS
jgi:hypothetical protein